MIGRRTTLGLSLLCALIFSAFAVQSASAAKAVNTTAVTCVDVGEKKGDFEDAHCDKKIGAEKGKFAHQTINLNETTEIEATNKTTGEATSPAVLKGEAFAAKVEITCTTAKTTAKKGFIHNVEDVEKIKEGEKEVEIKKHTVTGELTAEFSVCSVQKPAKCIVKEPIEVKSTFEGVEGELEAGSKNKEEMGVEFSPPAGKPFASITFLNKGAEKCSLNEKTVNVEGKAIGTGTSSTKEPRYTGATLNFSDLMTTQTLTFGGVAAGFDSTNTVKMVGGNPIALTTAT